MQLRYISTLIVIISGLLFTGCPSALPSIETKVQFKAPAHFPPVVYTPEVTKAKFDLGKKLFYDGILSRDGKVSCGSCHQQKGAFAHIDHALSHGVDDLLGTRNSPTIQNMAWNTSFFWDGGVPHLDLQPLAPIENPVEMDQNLAALMTKLRKHPTYPSLFHSAFGTSDTTQIVTARLGEALAAFMKMMVSSNSKYDQSLLNQGVSLTAEEQQGKVLFEQKCGTCHSGALFTDMSFRNNGLATTADSGRAHITHFPQDRFLFRVPSLRNIEVSYPYMHDGRFETLEDVLQHYATGVQNTPNLDTQLKQNGTLGIPMTAAEQTKIIAFLRTLTDNTFLNDPLFAE